MSHGTVTPMGRIVPTEGARICDEFIPAGVRENSSHHVWLR